MSERPAGVQDVVITGTHRDEDLIPAFMQELYKSCPREVSLIDHLYAEEMVDPETWAYHPEWWEELRALRFHLTQRLNYYANARGMRFRVQAASKGGKCACRWGYEPVLQDQCGATKRPGEAD